jgi:hypothetical protein
MNQQIVQAVKSLRLLSYDDFKFAVSLARPDRPAKVKGNGRRRKKPGPKPGSKRTVAAAPVAKAKATRIEAPQANA